MTAPPVGPCRAHPDPGAWTTFLWLVGGYVVIHFVLRLIFEPVLGTDDVDQAIYAQTLAWGYELKQPPLYTWLQWGLDQLIGIGVYSHALLKYLLLFLTYLFLYLGGRLIFTDRLSPLLAVTGLWLTFPLAVSIHQGVTHSILLSAVLAATLYVFLRLERQPSPSGYLVLGLLLGLGLISKFSFAVFAAALALAALSMPRYRKVVLNPLTLAGLLVTVLILLPPGLWIWQRHQEVGHAVAGLGSVSHGIAARLGGLVSAALQFPAPLWLVLLAVYPRAFGRLAGPRIGDAGILLGRIMLIGLALLALLVVLGQFEVKPRWLHPVLLVFPLYFFTRVAAAYPGQPARRGYLYSLAVLPVLVIGFWTAQTYLGPGLGKPTRFHVPYDRLAASLHSAVGNPATLVAGDPYLAGNLRLGFTSARVINADYPIYRPGPRQPGACLLVWDKAGRAAGVPDNIAAQLSGDWNRRGRPAPATLSVPYPGNAKFSLKVSYALVDGPSCP